ncbi:MAG: GNAT family N-acetyltransferase [Solirubrobacteraceae bacterium]|jgi:ribosomal protein S18 acetylase RimI-like enzyme
MAADIELLRLGVADAGELLTLQRAAYVSEAQLHEDPLLPPLVQTLTELAAELGDSERFAWGVRDGPRLVASVRVALVGLHAAEFSRLCVVPDRQGIGIGSALMLAAEQRLPAGVGTVRLFTGERSPRNLHLYSRLGYLETGRRSVGSYKLVYFEKIREA